MNLLEKSILSTITYYDTLDYPLTSFEVFKYLVNPLHIAGFYYSGKKIQRDFKKSSIEVGKLAPYQNYGAGFSNINLVNIRKILNSKELKKFVKEKNGFYFLKGPASPGGGQGGHL